MKRILIIAAHPDDEVLGCGGTMAKLANTGHEVNVLLLSKGKAARSDKKKATPEITKIIKEAEKANQLLGTKELIILDFPDNEFDSISLLSIVKEIEKIKKRFDPEIIFTHHSGDLNIDHQLAHKAVLTATRPLKEESVREIYSFEIPSSTEWNAFERNNCFIPNFFIDISDTLEKKLEALKAYDTEIRKYPHPRSLQVLKELAAFNGIKVGLKYSENFTLIRAIKAVI